MKDSSFPVRSGFIIKGSGGAKCSIIDPKYSQVIADSAKLVIPRSLTDEEVGGPVKNMGGPIKLLYITMFEIGKSCVCIESRSKVLLLIRNQICNVLYSVCYLSQAPCDGHLLLGFMSGSKKSLHIYVNFSPWYPWAPILLNWDYKGLT